MLPYFDNKIILNLFPPPKFLELPYVGVDLSDQSIKFIELERVGSRLSIKRFGEKVFPVGLIKNGEILNRQDLVTLIKKFRRESNLEYVHISLPEEKAFLFKTTVPNVTDAEIRSNLTFQLEKHVPISISEAVYDYDIIKEAGNNMLEVMVTVFPKKFIEIYLAVFKDAGLTPLSFEIEAQAIARAIIKRPQKETTMIVDFGRKRTGLSIVENNVVQFTSTIDIGGDAITEIIKQTLKIPDSEISKVKNEQGFTKLAVSNELYTNLSTIVSALKDEINKHYNYWQNAVDQGRSKKIEKIILCGGNANLAGLAEHFCSSMKIKTEKANTWANTFSTDDYIPPINYRESLGFSTAVGLALTDII